MIAPRTTHVTVIAPSGPVPDVEFQLGINELKQRGFQVKVHPQVFEKNLFFAGTDQSRASAFWDAVDDDSDVIWCARGGYGVARLLPLLEKEWKRRQGLKKKVKATPKTLIGFSDITALFQWCGARLKYRIIHGPMPGVQKFTTLNESQWDALNVSIHQDGSVDYAVKSLGKNSPQKKVQARLTGGNLCVLASLVGTDFQPRFKGQLVFIEEVDESGYRMDRMLNQMVQAGVFDGAVGIVLGTFTGCVDKVPEVLATVPGTTGKPISKKPLRPIIPTDELVTRVFIPWAERLNIPLWGGLPVGHGDGLFPLVMGEKIRIESGRLFF